MKIYTRTGDKGQTSLVDGTRVSKASLRVKAYGSVDELNSMIGVVIAEIANSKFQISHIQEELIPIQHDLFALGAYLANPKGKVPGQLTKQTTDFEKLIDTLTKELPPLKHFILPGGSNAGSFLHVARTLCRKAERHIVSLTHEEQVDEGVIKYINRLSDLLFTMARSVNQQEKQPEIAWSKKI